MTSFGTLFKHDVLRTRASLGVAALAVVALWALGLLALFTGWPVISTVGLIGAFAAILILPVAVQITLLVDFWRTGFGRAGYLTHTLPTHGRTLYASRLAWAWSASLLALVVSAGLFLATWPVANRHTPGAEGNPFVALREQWESLTQVAPTWLLVIALVSTVVMVLIWPAHYYFAVSVGAQAPLNRLGLGGPVLVGLGTYLGTQVLLFLSFLAIPRALSISGGEVELVPFHVFEEMSAGTDPEVLPFGFAPVLVLLTLAMIVWTARVWDRKISLV